jgi:hypothetical protein
MNCKNRSFTKAALMVMMSLVVPMVTARAAQEASLPRIMMPANQAQVVWRADREIRSDLQRALKADRSLDDSSIRVSSVSKGVVFLGGHAASLNDIVRALRLASGRPGVRGVFSEIEAVEAVAPRLGRRVVGVQTVLPPSVGPDPIEDRDDVMRRGGNADRLDAVRSMTGVRPIMNENRVVALNVDLTVAARLL